MRILSLIAAFAMTATAAAAQSPTHPSYYPKDYGSIVEASRKESGLVVYSNMADYNWKPVIAGFNELYPWIQVQTLDLGSGTVHSRWEAEAKSNSRTADLLVSGANDRWVRHGLDGDMMDYASPELSKLPDFARPFPGVYVMSTDPLIITYNTALLPAGKRPTGFRSLVKAAVSDPGTFKGRITTYDAARNSFGLAAWWTMLDTWGDEGWQLLRQVGPMIRGETSGGPMNEKVTTGEYVVGIAVSGITVFPRLKQAGGKIIGVVFPDDGTPLMFRGMGIPKNAANPNAARLFLDFVLSQKGQTVVGKGGLTPYRVDVRDADIAYTYQSIAAKVGEKNLIKVGFDKAMVEQADAFARKWSAALAGR